MWFVCSLLIPKIETVEVENNYSAPSSSQGDRVVEKKSKSFWKIRKWFSKWRKSAKNGQEENNCEQLTVCWV